MAVFCKNEENPQIYLINNVILKVTHNDKQEEPEQKVEEDISFRPTRSYYNSQAAEVYD